MTNKSTGLQNGLDRVDPSVKPLEYSVQRIKSGIVRSHSSEPTKKDKLYRQRLQLFTLKESFISELSEIRSRLEIPSDGFENVDKLERWLDSSIGQQEGGGGASDPNEVFAHSLGYLIKEFQIGDRWLWALCAYIFFGETKWHDLLPNPVQLESDATPDIEGDGKYIDVRVYPEATRKDLVDMWEDIKLGRSLNEMDRQSTIYLKGISTRDMENMSKLLESIEEFSDTHNRRSVLSDQDKLERNIKALELERRGKGLNEIARVLSNEDFVQACGHNDVTNYLNNIKQRINNMELS